MKNNKTTIRLFIAAFLFGMAYGYLVGLIQQIAQQNHRMKLGIEQVEKSK